MFNLAATYYRRRFPNLTNADIASLMHIAKIINPDAAVIDPALEILMKMVSEWKIKGIKHIEFGTGDGDVIHYETGAALNAAE